VTQRLEKPSRHREAQQHRVVYHRVSYAPERDEHSGVPYTPHRVLRASPRFFWVHADCVTREDWTREPPEEIRTYQLDRPALDAGEEVHRAREWGTWVLTPLPPAIEEHGYWVDYLDATAQRSGGTSDCLTALGLTLPCTAAEVTSVYRQLARTAHPDSGGTHEAFLTLPGHYEAALQLRGARG
jgi:hypothetical protein